MNNTDDGNRNFRLSMPIEQRANRRNPPPEVSSFRHPATRILDDVMLMDGVRNSDISNRWFNNEDVPYEELLHLQFNLQRQLPRVNTAYFSGVNTDDGNRNFRPSTPVERRTTNQDNSTPEVSSIDLPATRLPDGVMLVDGVRNSDWFTNEYVSELNALVVDWELQELLLDVT